MPSKPIRYRNRSWLLRFYAVFGVFALLFGAWQIWTGITWDYGKFKAPIFDFSGALSLVIGPLFVGFGSLMLFAFLRTPAILTADTLRVPKGFRRISIPVQDIAGVGLMFKGALAGTRVPPGWYLTVWRTDGDQRYTGIGYFPAVFRRNKRGGGKSRSLITARFDPVADTDARQLSLTHAARVARDIYDHVLACQGPSGPLAVQQLQKHVQAFGPWARSPSVGFWSPDGVLGPAGGSTDPKT
jgi:hypothetical protein